VEVVATANGEPLAAGSYDLAAYYAYAKTLGDADLEALVKAMYNYSVVAAAYAQTNAQ